MAVDPKALLKILHSDSGANTMITIKLDGGESRVMVKEYQLDPISTRCCTPTSTSSPWTGDHRQRCRS